jgi:hypothetical protein
MSKSTETGPMTVPLERLYEFHRDMHENHIMLTYGGDFSQEVTLSVLTMTERKLMADNIGEATRKKIFNVMIESLQNICKHQPYPDPMIHGARSVFMIGHNGQEFLLISGNPIHQERSAELRARIEELNSMDAEQIKEHYRQTRLSTRLSDVSGAGLGFIDMIKRTGNPLIYNIETINEKYDYFTLMVKVSKIENE